MDDELIGLIITKITIIVIIIIIVTIIIIILIKGTSLHTKTTKVWWKIINNSANLGPCH